MHPTIGKCIAGIALAKAVNAGFATGLAGH
jgi:hypothetical protein